MKLLIRSAVPPSVTNISSLVGGVAAVEQGGLGSPCGVIRKVSTSGASSRRSPVGVISVRLAKRRAAVDREVGGDPAAERVADEVDAVEPERVEEAVVVQDEVVEAVEPVGQRRGAEAGCSGAMTSWWADSSRNGNQMRVRPPPCR
ncbi:MAG: hypothetical protein R2736_22965 [Solirubrobacterales bacterium]